MSRARPVAHRFSQNKKPTGGPVPCTSPPNLITHRGARRPAPQVPGLEEHDDERRDDAVMAGRPFAGS
eukprot:5983602-Heterocapsa_arctica.AAC.1